VHTTHGIPVACRYTVLSNCQEPQEPNDIFSSNSEQSSRIMPLNKQKYITGLRRKKTLSVSQTRLPMSHQLIKPNLQEARKNEDGASFIPTIVNGVTDVNSNPKIEPKCNNSISNLINNLKKTIIVKKKKCSLSKTQ
jgi:hypothetical protein